MDELIIDEKKYVSSKQAAKITGYAKDYVGQMCREGRIPAQLVGRSWYVLESAIREHRFGDAASADRVPAGQTDTVHVDAVSVAAVWDMPRYESIVHEPLPEPRKDEPVTPAPASPNKSIDESWDEWYRLVQAKKDAGPQPETLAEGTVDQESQISVKVYHEGVVDEERVTMDAYEKSARRPRQKVRVGRVAYRIVISILALAAVALAAINSGYLDRYITSYSRDLVPAGINVLTK